MKFRNDQNIAIIPARGGSKRIPRKNIKSFLGKPIIQYPIEKCLKSNLFDNVIVSTDDNEIAQISKQFEADVPFLRSSKNSDDYATLSDVILEVLEIIENRGMKYKYGCCVLPTSPLMFIDNLEKAFKKISYRNYDSVFPITKTSQPIFKALKVKDDKVQFIWNKYSQTRTQDLEETYFDCGQFYWFNVEKFKHNHRLITDNSGYIVLPGFQIQDIDSIEDWKIAEFKYRILHDKIE